jgi:hypothetical protein
VSTAEIAGIITASAGLVTAACVGIVKVIRAFKQANQTGTDKQDS